MLAGATGAVAKLAVEDQRTAEQIEREAEELRQQAAFATSDSHGEKVAIEWNNIERITTDFDRDSMTCKRCISVRKCTNQKWHLFTDRTCDSWGKWETPKCNELKF